MSAVPAAPLVPRVQPLPNTMAIRCSQPAWARTYRRRRFTPNLKSDSTKDFAPIGLTSNAPAVVVARKDFPAKDFKEFVAYLKKNGDSVKQAHGGVGSSSHMACLLFSSELGLKPNLVAYRGTGPALNDVDRRSRRFLLRAGRQRAGRDEGRHGQSLCGVRQQPLACGSRCSVGQGSRRKRLPDQHLERDLRAERNAEADRRQAQRRAQQGARRSGGGQAAGSSSAAPCRPRRIADRRISPACSRPILRAGIRS